MFGHLSIRNATKTCLVYLGPSLAVSLGPFRLLFGGALPTPHAVVAASSSATDEVAAGGKI